MNIDINHNDLSKAKQLILNASRIAILSHAKPDGDAVGSSNAIALFLRSLGKEVSVSYPNAFAANLAWMPGASNALIWQNNRPLAEQTVTNADLIIITDLNELTRLNTGAKSDGYVGLSKAVINSTAPKILFDHHELPSSECDIIFSFPPLSSASEVVFRVFQSMQLIDQFPFPALTCLYAGMMTDTGFFSYSCSYPEFFHTIAYLVSKGIKHVDIVQNFNAHDKADQLRLNAFLTLNKMQLFPELHTAITILTEDEKNSFHYEPGFTEGFVNHPLQIEGINRSIFIKEERQQNMVKISFRSQGNVNVERLARELFDGGGHFNASGAETKTLNAEEVKQRILQRIQEEEQKQNNIPQS